ncbi:hypothetical protein JTE90_011507 [Oedothorax gibbosus]|uniref:Uncharacterized protein n=1 Tax=Oedothorax gibbosus TaxID=931172 RepID=A0AAV6TFM5_9ARAC|nr:hypothetical protein JTE90_011507 [Oedothorax gibbosus]
MVVTVTGIRVRVRSGSLRNGYHIQGGAGAQNTHSRNGEVSDEKNNDTGDLLRPVIGMSHAKSFSDINCEGKPSASSRGNTAQ